MAYYKYATTADILADVLTDVDDGDAAQVAAIGRFAEAASAMIDRYCKRPAGFFLAHTGDATVRRYRGKGQNFLAIGRHTADAVTVENIEDSLIYIHGENGWIYAVDNSGGSGLGDEDFRFGNPYLFSSNAVYKVTAKWGFTEIPADIVQACKLIVQHQWQVGRGVVGQVSPLGFVIERDMPPPAQLLLDGWKRRQFEIN